MLCIYPYLSGSLHWHWGNDFPYASEATLKDVGYISQPQTAKCLHISWNPLHIILKQYFSDVHSFYKVEAMQMKGIGHLWVR